MDNDTYLDNSDVIKKLDDLSAAVGGTTVPTTTTKTNTDFVIGINKSIDAASGKTGVEYPPYSHNTLVTDKLDELAGAIAAGGGGGPGPTPVMGALSVTENGDYLPSSYNYDGFSSVSVDVPEPPTPVTDVLNITENGTYLPSDYSCDAFSQVNVNVAPTPTTYEAGVLSIAGSPATLSFDTSSDNHIIVDYEIPYNVTNMSVCGTSNGSNQLMHITTWGTVLYIGTGSGEYVVGRGSSYVEGRHTFEFNRNGYIYFDDVQSNAITPSNNAITIGGRGGYNLYGLIYSVEIKSNSTGDTLLKLVPDEQNGEVGFTDEISGTFYQCGHKLVYSEVDT